MKHLQREPALSFNLVLLLAVSALFVTAASARPWRVDQIPNGNKFRCLNCHHSPYGGPRSSFGLAVENVVGRGSKAPFWNSVLAAKDSDGDGSSNGEELGDPDGDGNPTAGANIANPGDAKSKPPKPVEPVAPEIVIQTSKSPFGFQFKTVKGQTYEIQATTDLRKWTVVDTIEGTGSDKMFSDLREAVFELQYYRVRVRD
ncbi:MAG: hypothetical protein H8E20_01120 [Verrucomicrobia bacterium]|nr:hypothetical protein [Verrucomicrobiota bacterium]